MRWTPNPASPGEMLAEKFLKARDMSNDRLAKKVGVPARRPAPVPPAGAGQQLIGNAYPPARLSLHPPLCAR